MTALFTLYTTAIYAKNFNREVKSIEGGYVFYHSRSDDSEISFLII